MRDCSPINFVFQKTRWQVKRSLGNHCPWVSDIVRTVGYIPSTSVSFEHEYKQFLAFSMILFYKAVIKVSRLRISYNYKIKEAVECSTGNTFVEKICLRLVSRILKISLSSELFLFNHNFSNNEDISTKFTVDLPYFILV